MAEEEAEGEAKAEKPKGGGGGSGPLILMVLVGLNLGLSAFVLLKVLGVSKEVHHLSTKAAQAEGEGETGEEEEGEGEEGQDGGVAKKPKLPKGPAGPIVALESMTVNLNEPGKPRYLKAAFELEATNPEAHKLLEDRKRLIRDVVMAHLSGLTVADTSGEEARSRLQAELRKKLDGLLGGKKVRWVYLTEFLVQ